MFKERLRRSISGKKKKATCFENVAQYKKKWFQEEFKQNEMNLYSSKKLRFLSMQNIQKCYFKARFYHLA